MIWDSGSSIFSGDLTEEAVRKVKEMIEAQAPRPVGLRIAVGGGGCSGFSYSMNFENSPGMLDKTYDSDGFKVFVDQASLIYLDGIEVDVVNSLEGAGFKFNNPETCHLARERNSPSFSRH